MSKKTQISRRAALGALGLGGGALLLDGLLGLRHARADVTDPDNAPLLVMCEFANGWDTLYCLDPRNHQDFNEPAGGIFTGFDMVTDVPTKNVIEETGGTGLVKPVGSEVAFGPTMSKLAREHFQDLCVVRGVNMGTLTHEVGRRYFLTGKFPRGLAASGSSLETWWAAASNAFDAHEIPNLVAGGAETYNEGLTPLASGLQVPSYNEMLQVLRPLNASVALDGKVEQAAAKFHQTNSCVHRQLDAGGQLKTHLSAWGSAQSLANGGLWKHFDFKSNPPAGSQLEKLYQAFSVDPTNPAAALAGKPRGQAALAAQALVNRISQVVLLRLVNVTDAHFDDDWPSNHPARQRSGFDAVSELITYLQNTEDKNGKSFWDRTTLLCFSEFARTPRINQQGGRDHHLASACLVAGHGIRGNQVIGATKDTNYDGRPINVATGAPDDEMGTIIKPSDVHATLLRAAGLPYDHISNQEPKLIQAMLANP
ncbi:DUF1501 domain-containing protein [Chondromyces apiculatus]|uniref:Tat (Twin-arginine translocation) pathway signal sequence domain protein n=1 Tax=Chondromyces apiculatus DSM 436 TaxID=1192034 RepID=A0A017T259_9BACT|nr:DUF1501 domain-containing protein [Chondromyces apiculatus]EYF03333.1 Tat (twin-arginine translocation) pathway signal sequence domain protein [Chondromyces apiculatus DSM 436]